MIRNCIVITALAASSLLAALGSGPFIRAGVGITSLSGTDLYMLPEEHHYLMYLLNHFGSITSILLKANWLFALPLLWVGNNLLTE